MDQNKIILSELPKTWFIDLDGTLLKHNGYKEDGIDTLIPKSIEFIKKIPTKDTIIFVTSRESAYSLETEEFLKKNQIRYNQIIYDIPMGERILINDDKPSGLITAYAINVKRNEGIDVDIELNPRL